jgi:hypothetical protein
MQNHLINRLFSIALPILVAGSVIMLVAYAAIQQSYRQSANDPQIELAEDAAAALSGGSPADGLLLGMPQVDMSQSLMPFIMIFDDSGKLLSSSAYVNGSPSAAGLPTPPHGVFDFVRSNKGAASSGFLSTIKSFRSSLASNQRPAGEDRFTWQTASGLRFATVVTRWDISVKNDSSVSSSSSSPSAIVQNQSASLNQTASSSGFILAARSLREVEIREGQLGEIFLIGWLVFVVGTIGVVVVETLVEKRLKN